MSPRFPASTRIWARRRRDHGRHEVAAVAGDQAAEVAGFLRAHLPFDALAPADVERVASAAELEHHPAGSLIFGQGDEPLHHLRVVRSGTVEIVADGRVLDVLTEGEIFGHASMLSGLPTGFEARAIGPTDDAEGA